MSIKITEKQRTLIESEFIKSNLRIYVLRKICCVAFNIHIIDMANGYPSGAWLDDFHLCDSRFSLARTFNKSSTFHIIFRLYDISCRISNISDRLSIPEKLFGKLKQGRPPRKPEKGAVRCCRRAMRGYNSGP